MANYPNRCQHLKINGTQGGSPALRRNRFCFVHKRFQDEPIKLAADRKRGVATFILPVLEDANSIQIALMQVMRLLVSHQIEHKTASLLLYALQTASTNLRMTDFKPRLHEVILDPRDVVNTYLGQDVWEDQDFEEEEEETVARAQTRPRGSLVRTHAGRAHRKRPQAWRERREIKDVGSPSSGSATGPRRRRTGSEPSTNPSPQPNPGRQQYRNPRPKSPHRASPPKISKLTSTLSSANISSPTCPRSLPKPSKRKPPSENASPELTESFQGEANSNAPGSVPSLGVIQSGAAFQAK